MTELARKTLPAQGENLATQAILKGIYAVQNKASQEAYNLPRNLQGARLTEGQKTIDSSNRVGAH
jgi:hypothetical protein